MCSSVNGSSVSVTAEKSDLKRSFQQILSCVSLVGYILSLKVKKKLNQELPLIIIYLKLIVLVLFRTKTKMF